ncbi:hypothetical protein HLB23_00005 [Nocardia uniformis]|uniref:Uncharacterized protein n=1 Tax=Nocardia uniformis TaxID=53432 RepID=A0A849BTG7_9NOCA
MTDIPGHWIPHRRADGEVVGWIDLESQAPDLVPVDRLGSPLDPVSDWSAAEETLEHRGLGFLLNRFHYRGHTVRIRQLYPDHIIVTTAVSDAIGDVGEEFTLPFPAGADLTEVPR